ncbi:DUF2007 domain-containing protein [Advenella sp. WQ 585]|jgi:hypothetical protein|uniref:DUF2007 domain-containing protein n=1 Tax=Advenella mandrilli TaxID=2800330 RepID=A0ABS1EG82_9BURK|nr:DUF2007 domain-containing protein [Advenella mandrilli]MBK1781947.1 DUF2007 domain-containing protein [Advenella mandrilli]MDY0273547.1 DUF2007 domain-containing protein [Advenella sp.]
MDMIPIYTMKSEPEAAVISSLMTAYDINFIISGRGFSSMYPGAVSTSLNEQILMVQADQVELAQTLLEPFLNN